MLKAEYEYQLRKELEAELQEINGRYDREVTTDQREDLKEKAIREENEWREYRRKKDEEVTAAARHAENMRKMRTKRRF